MKPILYSTGCPRCVVLKKKLNEKGIQYDVCDDTDKMISLGIQEVPVLFVDDSYLDFSRATRWLNEMKG